MNFGLFYVCLVGKKVKENEKKIVYFCVDLSCLIGEKVWESVSKMYYKTILVSELVRLIGPEEVFLSSFKVFTPMNTSDALVVVL